MGQVITADNVPDLVIASTTTITMAASYLGKPTRITIGGQQYKYSSLTTLNFASTGFNGLDTGSIAANTLYYIYAVQSSGTPGLVASLAAPTVGPTGFVVWREVGRCRTLLTAATLASVSNRIGGTLQFSGIVAGQSYTPSSAITNATTDFRQWREGETMLAGGTIKWSNTGSMSGLTAAQIFPSGLSYKPLTDSASGLGAGKFNLGPAEMEDFGTQSYNGFMIATYTDASNAFTSISFSNVLSAAGAPFTPAANDVVTFSCKVRVVEWVGLYT